MFEKKPTGSYEVEFDAEGLTSGILNGIYRSYLLEEEIIKEKEISLEDLLKADEIKLVNSVRGEIKVNQLCFRNEVIEF